MIIGTRESALAKWQTNTVISKLKELDPGIDIQVKYVKTTGDEVKDKPLSALGGFGAFVKELDYKIVDGEIDVAVNSLKDMPMELTEGTDLAAVLPRGPVEDVLLSEVPLNELPNKAVVGSSSVRRRHQLLAQRPDLVIKDLRGNVPTRIRKWKEGEYDAIVLARAGMERLGVEEKHFILDPEVFIPAVGQGAIAVACREGSEYMDLLKKLEDPKTRKEVDAERYVLRALGGGCSVPIGIWARSDDKGIFIIGSVIGRKGVVRSERTIPHGDVRHGLVEFAVKLSKGL